MLKSCIAFLGRFCLSLIFLGSAVSKILDWAGVEQLISQHLSELAGFTAGIAWAQVIIDAAFPLSAPLLISAIVLEVVGGLCLLLGINVRFGAVLLIIFLIPTTVLMHHFWYLPEPEHGLQLVMFLKNLAILGGLLLALAYGKGEPAAKHKPAKD